MIFSRSRFWRVVRSLSHKPQRLPQPNQEISGLVPTASHPIPADSEPPAVYRALRALDIFMDQNNKCNLQCKMCGFSDPRIQALPKYDMPFWLFARIAQQVFPQARYVTLSCLTEPLMTRDFSERLDLLKEFSVPVTEVVTNGMLLNERILAKIIDASLTRLAISIDGVRAETYEAIRIGARFDRLMKHIHLFNQMRAARNTRVPALRLNWVLTESNIVEFPQFLELAQSLQADFVDVRTVLPFKNAAYQGTKEHVFWHEVKRCHTLLQEWTRRTGITDIGYLRTQPSVIEVFAENGERHSCMRPWNTLAIHANGDVHPCMSWARLPVGNLSQQTFEEIWNGAEITALRTEFAAKKPGIDCEHCVIKKDVPSDEGDDLFFRMLNKTAPKPLIFNAP